MTATLTDGDATSTEIEIGAATWQWYRGNTAIEWCDSGQALAPLTPGLTRWRPPTPPRVTPEKASRTISVRAAPASNTEPNFENEAESRSVDENRANVSVGNRVTATDPGDTLTYSVSPNTHFSIDNNGQLKTKVALDLRRTLRPSS